MGQRRSLLILDGLEPLQYPSSATAFEPGQLKDQGIAKLLKDLATTNHGLCIVTSRIELPDLKAFKGGAMIEQHLKSLSRKAGVDLLKRQGVQGSELRNHLLKDGDEKSEKVNEFEKLVEDVKGHALTLTLLGGFLKRAFHGDIRQRDRVKFEKADEKLDGGHAFRTIAAYEQWLLRDGGDEGRREVAVLRLMGLFDRPAAAGCLAALRRETIPGLTEPLAGLADDDWEFCLSGLEAAKLLTVNRDASGALISLDAHPHLREYFARQLRTQQPDAWRAAHRRLYEHLCATTPDKPQPTLEDLQPLYQAVAHGCQTNLFQQALDEAFITRIRRDDVDAIKSGRGSLKNYSIYLLGAFSSDLSALLGFARGDELKSNLDQIGQAYVLNEIGACLRAVGRVSEAPAFIEPSLRLREQMGHPHGARSARNIAAAYIALGRLSDAVERAEEATRLAELSSDSFDRYANHCWLGRALHLTGDFEKAETTFREAKQRAQGSLVGLQAAFFCDLLVDRGLMDEATMVAQNALRVEWDRDKALCHYILAEIDFRKHFGCSFSKCSLSADEKDVLRKVAPRIEDAVRGLERASRRDEVPIALLARARLCCLQNDSNRAQTDLDEAWEVAERGPMKLHLADIHLHRARLFGVQSAECGVRNEAAKYPWESPAADLAAAEKLINACGYHRRDQELADAKRAILGQ
ncbi:MAG: tetratricopeptide repeat protein [Verrucomicrobia bacterium]|nr:tetratricopeptide repeat protein [Verrucomicrobiota bacterium]